MTIFNLGSINIDRVYRVATLPKPGETVADKGLSTGLGGKGANQSIAIARLGGTVSHVGAVGTDEVWARDALSADGVDIANISVVDAATGHAIIYVDDSAENVIIIHAGANRAITLDQVERALADAREGDWFLAQNETSMVAEAVATAKLRGLKVAYAAAPFDSEVAAKLIDHVDLLAVNQLEAQQLAAHLGVAIESLPAPWLLVTFGSGGAMVRVRRDDILATELRIGGIPVDALDTTGAGDTFLGAFLGAVDGGSSISDALVQATAAAALQVTRLGAAVAIPTAAELEAFKAGVVLPKTESYPVEGV